MRTCQGQGTIRATAASGSSAGRVVAEVECDVGMQCRTVLLNVLVGPVPSTGADVPSVQEVMRDDRFAQPDRGGWGAGFIVSMCFVCSGRFQQRFSSPSKTRKKKKKGKTCVFNKSGESLTSIEDLQTVSMREDPAGCHYVER